jgi:hypothetical protein
LEHCRQDVVLCPTHADALSPDLGFCLSEPINNDFRYFKDDTLTPEEELVIIGGYYEQGGGQGTPITLNSQPSNMDRVKTYFPRPSVWRNAFGSPAWDHNKEHEYQRFRNGYLSPSVPGDKDSPSKLQPRNTSEWRNVLRSKYKDTRKVASVAEHRAREFLSTRYQYPYLRSS